MTAVIPGPGTAQYKIFDGQDPGPVSALLSRYAAPGHHMQMTAAGMQVRVEGGRWQDVMPGWAVLVHADGAVGVWSAEALARHWEQVPDARPAAG